VKTEVPLTDLLEDAIAALLKKTCRLCSKELVSHAVVRVGTRSQKSWTSSATTALELMCPRPGGFQYPVLKTELRMRLVSLLRPVKPFSRPKKARKSVR